jgi:hypothetical protein
LAKPALCKAILLIAENLGWQSQPCVRQSY